jgi:uncharacterized protein
MNELERFRADKDDFFSSHPQSPLTTEQKRKFSGLDYFPENPELSLKLEIAEFSEQSKIEMQTSTGDIQVYIRFGKISFTVAGEEVNLTIFANPNGFFLPFVDSLAGKETYGAGRYLEPEVITSDLFLVDFNLAYNPYCAYNENYSCPLTPWENRLSVPIRAGERLPTGEWINHVL